MRFTSQDDHFPVWPKKDEPYQEAAARVKAQKFAIQDDLLYAALMWTTDIGRGQQMNGVWQSKHSTGYVLRKQSLNDASQRVAAMAHGKSAA
ncbi:hypothetical protein ACN9M1_05975 [Ralstonia sp. R-29]|uniref:hypothetical protein n=1 Tax=Ralstonia sp. R-29 TaxID=3404059 RepID=UPI003CE7A993